MDGREVVVWEGGRGMVVEGKQELEGSGTKYRAGMVSEMPSLLVGGVGMMVVEVQGG